MSRLLERGKKVMIETGGHRSIAGVPEGVVRIMDVKCPGSGEAARNDWTNLGLLTTADQVKFVLKDRADYEFARDLVAREGLPDRVGAVLFSPVHGVLDPRELAQWMLADRLRVRLQLQAHKFIWPAETRGV
jgi:7-carboxy-7-deazaguanine synthase